MASEGGVEMLIALLDTPSLHVQRQAAKALANLGVNGLFISVIVECYASDTHLSAVSNKAKIAQAGGIPRLSSWLTLRTWAFPWRQLRRWQT